MTRPRALLSASALIALLAAPAVSVAHDDGASVKVGAVTVDAVGHVRAEASGTVQAKHGTLRWWFEYGSGFADARSTPVRSAPGTGATVPVTAELTELKASTRHYVRLVAEQAGTREASRIVAFTTAPAPAPPAPAPDTPPSPSPDPAAHPRPALGETVVAVPAGGEVRVRVPGAEGFAPLGLAGAIPVGSVVDASAGRVRLRADTGGGMQRGTFGGGRFRLRQRADGYVDLHLRGGGLQHCGNRSLAAAGKRRPRRKLWGRDRGGRFRTHGRDSVATVRGTRWSVTDRCGGTLTKVSEGAVDVRVRRTGKVVRVRAGERHLARHR